MKYKVILEKKRRETEKREVRQKRLRKKYGICSEDKVIVERGIGIWHLWKVTKECVRIVIAGLFFLLAFVGMVGLMYAEPRNALYEIWRMLCEEVVYELTKGVYR